MYIICVGEDDSDDSRRKKKKTRRHKLVSILLWCCFCLEFFLACLKLHLVSSCGEKVSCLRKDKA